MKLYHGCNNVIQAIDNSQLRKSVNGFGFYLTNDITVARRYGIKVVCWEVDIDIPMVVRPINNKLGGMEYVIITQGALNDLLLECDAYEVSI